MNIENLQLKNYRNFEEYSIRFGKETTILIGKNGSGKTNLLTAIKQSLSFIFSKKRDEIQYDFIASSDQKVESFLSTDAKYVYNNEKQGNFCYPISIKAKAKIKDEIIKWRFLKENSSGLESSLYRKATEQYWHKYYFENEVGKDLPIFVFFSDSYPHITTTITNKIQDILNSGFELPRNTAYYKWDEDRNCTEIWVQYFIMQWKNDKYQNGKGNKEYLSQVNKKMIEFSRVISDGINSDDVKIKKIDIEARGKDDILMIIFENGTRTVFNQLPQGYKRIFSIAFDILNRAYLLNSNCNPSGIVLIDEVELHLHPSIAQEILNGLKLTFPNIQFIVSTHSPLVITNFKQNENNIIYKLCEEDGNYINSQIEDLYGIDYNSGLRDWMETPYRKFRAEELIKAYEYWKNVGDKNKIKKIKEKIKDEVGENSQLYKSLI